MTDLQFCLLTSNIYSMTAILILAVTTSSSWLPFVIAFACAGLALLWAHSAIKSHGS